MFISEILILIQATQLLPAPLHTKRHQSRQSDECRADSGSDVCTPCPRLARRGRDDASWRLPLGPHLARHVAPVGSASPAVFKAELGLEHGPRATCWSVGCEGAPFPCLCQSLNSLSAPFTAGGVAKVHPSLASVRHARMLPLLLTRWASGRHAFRGTNVERLAGA